MYLGIDIGGSKTIVARIDSDGHIKESHQFPTPQIYVEFLKEIAIFVAKLSTKEFEAAGVAVPGRIDRKKGIGHAFGNLPWKEIPIRDDLQKMLHCPVVIENDANLAGLSEALLRPEHESILYVTISTGIGTGLIVGDKIAPSFADSEGGQIMLEHQGELRTWESFASGKAIVKRFGKRASDIKDAATWKLIAHDIALGLFDLIAFVQPQAVILGGAVLTYYSEFDDFLKKELEGLETPLTPIPPIYQAQRPHEAVLHGCYYLAKDTYGKASPKT